jgi:hypothetical protein
MATPKRVKSPKAVMISVRLDDAENALLQQILERDGVPVSEQLRRGLRLWFEQKGVLKRKRNPD